MMCVLAVTGGVPSLAKVPFLTIPGVQPFQMQGGLRDAWSKL